MESRSKYSTTIGNALLVMHTFFEPGKKASDGAGYMGKEKKNPCGKGVRGLTELNYDKIRIGGYYSLRGKRFFRKIRSLISPEFSIFFD